MLEPEVTFATYFDLMDLGQKYLFYIIKKILLEHQEELKFLSNYYEKDLILKLKELIKEKDIPKISYKKAIEILKEAIKEGVKFEERDIKFGIDFGIEHERYLAKNYAKGPIFVYDYPLSLKAFYMKVNKDNETVKGFDLLIPEIGELLGGSERENDYDNLLNILKLKNLSETGMEWYLKLRKYGYAPSAGFGLGMERLVMLITGVTNIRDVLPFPRTPGKIEF